MDVGLLAQYVMNGLMLGMMYALVAVGFTLFFGVLDIIKFSHGDVLTVGAFTGLATYIGLRSVGVSSTPLLLLAVLVVAILAMAALGMLIARYLVMPLRSAPALNTLLITLDARHGAARNGSAVLPARRQPEAVPGPASNRLDQPWPVQPAARQRHHAGGRRRDHRRAAALLNRTKLGLAIRAVAQDEETARTMGINFTAIVLITFAIGSALAAIAGVMNGLYYNEINFGMGLCSA